MIILNMRYECCKVKSLPDPVLLHERVVVHWRGLCDFELLLHMAWQVSMMSVVDVLHYSVHSWVVVLVKLEEALVGVVLDSIAIGIVDSIGSSLPLRLRLEEDNIVKGVWAIDLVNETGKLSLNV